MGYRDPPRCILRNCQVLGGDQDLVITAKSKLGAGDETRAGKHLSFNLGNSFLIVDL